MSSWITPVFLPGHYSRVNHRSDQPGPSGSHFTNRVSGELSQEEGG